MLWATPGLRGTETWTRRRRERLRSRMKGRCGERSREPRGRCLRTFNQRRWPASRGLGLGHTHRVKRRFERKPAAGGRHGAGSRVVFAWLPIPTPTHTRAEPVGHRQRGLGHLDPVDEFDILHEVVEAVVAAAGVAGEGQGRGHGLGAWVAVGLLHEARLRARTVAPEDGATRAHRP